jgi:hypothetical protein
VKELAELAGITADDLPEELPALRYEDDYLTNFTEQLDAMQSAATVSGVLAVINVWTSLGGTLWLGRGSETSCFLVAREGQRPDNLWPVVLYPTGKCEVVFQHMAVRPPFDDIELRQEFRRRLNKIPGVDLPESKLGLRPGFPLELLADKAAQVLFLDALKWFYERANPSPVTAGTEPDVAE